MDIVIGIQLSTREIEIEVSDDEGAKVRDQVEQVFAASSEGSQAVLWITDKDSRTIGVPADKVAYIEIGSDKAAKPVGFSAAS